jgi:uncharacterized membrane protein YozB (DUF420 family)
MISLLPSINATLNALSAVLLVCGYLLIRRKQIARHRKVMQTAFATSCLFLVCYLVYHAQVGSVPFHHEGTTLRTVYLSILFTHTVLAAAVPVLAIITLRRGLAARSPGLWSMSCSTTWRR